MPVITIDLKADEMGAALLLSMIALAWSEEPIPTPREALGFAPEEIIPENLGRKDAVRLNAFGQERYWETLLPRELDPGFALLDRLTVHGRCYYLSTLMYHHLDHFRYTPHGSKFLSHLLASLGKFSENELEWLSEEQVEAVGLFLQFCLVFDEKDPQLVDVSMKWADYVERYAASSRALAA